MLLVRYRGQSKPAMGEQPRVDVGLTDTDTGEDFEVSVTGTLGTVTVADIVAAAEGRRVMRGASDTAAALQAGDRIA